METEHRQPMMDPVQRRIQQNDAFVHLPGMRVDTVSRRASVECFKCNGVMMQPVKLEYTQYVKMSEQERMDYADSWMYIHRKKSK